jgi:hypothetical protein
MKHGCSSGSCGCGSSVPVGTFTKVVGGALVFVARTQNIPGNEATWAQHGTKDGGFVYTPSNGGESFASDAAGEGRYGEKMPPETRALRSYGSMTYAGFKSMLYAGLAPNDPRVVAAFDWIRSHYGFAENPGLGAQGLYYYLHAASRALMASGAVSIVPIEEGKPATPRNWRNDLVDAVIGAQRPDGSWVNGADRWQEGRHLNLEPALKLGDELGGHIVAGHVDGVGTVVSIEPVGDSRRFVIAAPRELAPYLAPKGSITVDGISLTVNEVSDEPDGTCHFALNIIPHTAEVTTIGAMRAGDGVNLEIDVLARYLQRMQSLRS